MLTVTRVGALIVGLILLCGFYHGTNTPGPALQWGFSKLAFTDNMASLSTVDVNNTKAAGFKWYTNNQWPLVNANGSAWTPLITAAATPSSYLSTVGSQLMISDDISHLAFGVTTAAATGSGSTFVGQTFTGGFYVEVTMTYDPTKASSTAAGWEAWPSYWFVPKEFLTGAITNTNFVELDGFECYPSSPGACSFFFATHDWNTSNGTNNDNSNLDQSSFFSGFNFAVSHKYGTLYVPKSLNGGTGLIQRFVDGVHLSGADVSFTASGTPSPAFTPTNSVGAVSEMDNENFIMILSAGHPSWPVTYGQINIWQLP